MKDFFQKENAELLSSLIADLERLSYLLDKPITDATYAEVVGHGEIWSARLMASLLTEQDYLVWLDAREFCVLKSRTTSSERSVISAIITITIS